MQEIELMNFLLLEIIKSCRDLDLAFKGELTMTEDMENIVDNLVIDKVPPNWQKLAYPSTRGLASWLSNLQQRMDQLNIFKDEPTFIMKVTNISRFFNPSSFLTAIKQKSARASG